MEKRGLVLQFYRFAIVGVFATFVNLVIFYLVTRFFNFYYLLSAIVAFFVADAFKYILSKSWAFGDGLRGNFLRKYSKFLCVSLVALVLNLIFLLVFKELFHLHYMLSQILAILMSLWINFIGNKFWTFGI